ncbi:TetR/AcrR family transcriptional regulator [Actinophytocola xanthii]|uniref:TetR family transcriptional regulator n=1 Tax=Actinophytocola xanthii TaxID=1912961 RepID=A0A1Q8CGE7_9PSEU|nr:TetR/AcrR family transcriptional regulator [Actinophytocola xanthii]OLF13390.1 TetR family transcriptional regulator [Actinophytocola xanthii]
MDVGTAETRALDAAEDLFYRRGVHAVGMADIRDAAGVSLKRLYQLFPSKEQLVTAFLRRRDGSLRASLAAHVDRRQDPDQRILAVFDWLRKWFAEPSYRGCAWVNLFGELGATSPAVAEEARLHKDAMLGYLRELAAAAGRPTELADQLLLLVEGAITMAAITGSEAPALRARAAAATLLDASR